MTVFPLTFVGDYVFLAVGVQLAGVPVPEAETGVE